MATNKETLQVDINFNPDTASIKSFRDQIKAVMAEMDKTADPKKFAALSSQLGELRNDFGDLRQKIKASDPGEMLANVVKLTQGVVGAFSGISAGFELIAGDNKAMQEAMGKTAKVIQLLQGLESARQLLENKGTVAALTGYVKKALGISAVTVAKQAETVATVEGESAQIAMNVAAYANPYVLLAIAIAALVVGIAAYSSGARDAAEQNVKTLEGLEKVKEAHTANTAVTELAIAQTKLELEVNTALADIFETVRVKLGGLTDAQLDHLGSTKDMTAKVQEFADKRLAIAEAEGKSEKEIFNIKKQNAYNIALVNQKQLDINKELSNDEKKVRIDNVKAAAEEYKKVVLEEKLWTIKTNRETSEKKIEDDLKAWEDSQKAKKEFDKEVEAYIKSERERISKEAIELSAKKVKEAKEEVYKIAEIRLKALNLVRDSEENSGEEEEALRMKRLAREYDLETNQYLKLKELKDQGLIDERDYNAQIQKLDQETFDKKLQGANQIATGLKNILLQSMNNEIDAAEGNAEEQKRIREEYQASIKAAATAEAIINGAVGISAIWSSWGELPIVAAALTAIEVAAVALQLQTISNQEFAKGGVLDGPSHANGGITTPFGELEGGEGVINKRSMANPQLRNMASMINEAGGGVSFRNNSSGINTTNSISREEAIELVAAAVNSQQVYLVESDVTKSQKKVRTIEQRSKI
jgi:hypothetical protein